MERDFEEEANDEFYLPFRNFDDIPPEKYKEVALKTIKACLKNYHQLNSSMYPQSSAVHKGIVHNFKNIDAFSLKLDIDKAINSLSLKSKKIIILLWILQMPLLTVRDMLGFKHRVDIYRRSNEAYDAMYEFLGTNWLRTRIADEKK